MLRTAKNIIVSRGNETIVHHHQLRNGLPQFEFLTYDKHVTLSAATRFHNGDLLFFPKGKTNR